MLVETKRIQVGERIFEVTTIPAVHALEVLPLVSTLLTPAMLTLMVDHPDDFARALTNREAVLAWTIEVMHNAKDDEVQRPKAPDRGLRLLHHLVVLANVRCTNMVIGEHPEHGPITDAVPAGEPRYFNELFSRNFAALFRVVQEVLTLSFLGP